MRKSDRFEPGFSLRLICCGMGIFLCSLPIGCGDGQSADVATDAQFQLTEEAETVPTATLSLGRKEYVGSDACQRCHDAEHSSWHDSFHRTMTQWAGPESIVAPFDQTLSSRGRSYEFWRDGDEFWVKMLDPALDQMVSDREVDQESLSGLPVKDYQVLMTTGSHVAQTYWVETDAGLQHVPWMFHIEEQKWIPNEDSFLLPPQDDRIFSVWNTNCSKCHSVGPKPGQLDEGFQSRVAELGISCEACHGPGKSHVDYREQLAQSGKEPLGNEVDPIVNPAHLDANRGSQICGQCHSAHLEANVEDWLVNGSPFRPGEDLNEFVSMHEFGTAQSNRAYGTGHWGDGTVRTGGDEFLAMKESACFKNGEMSCMSCHSMHDYESTTDQLRASFSNDENCFQCHDDLRGEIEAHTHHSVDSSGSRCANCHMPHISYALFKGIRSHRIDSPNAQVSKETGRPNACNLCHLDKSLAWTGDVLHQWYEHEIPEFSADDESTSSVLSLLLKGEAAQRIIAAWHLGWDPAIGVSGNSWQAPFLIQLLDDPYSMVRYVSYLTLKRLPGFEDFEYDFLVESERRQERQAWALNHWESITLKELLKNRRQLLFDASGNLQSDLLQQLLEQRDDRPIYIAE